MDSIQCSWTYHYPDTQCQCPLPPSYGLTSACSGYASPGYEVSYYCTGEYSLAGAKTRTCQGNGSWTEMSPSCIKGEKNALL